MSFTIHPSELQDYQSSCALLGYPCEEFTLRARDTTKEGPGLFPLTAQLAIERKSKAIVRFYDAGDGSSWPAAFEDDLRAGLFGPV